MRKKLYILLILAVQVYSLQAQENRHDEADVVPVQPFEDLYRLDNFYISAQPELARMTWLKDQGVRTIINLRSEEENKEFKEEAFDEQFVAEKLGFTYHSLPIDSKKGFTPENQAAFNALADGITPILVHCQSGKRATYFFIAYLVQEEGYSLADAVKIGRQMKYSTPLELLLDEEFILEIDTDQ